MISSFVSPDRLGLYRVAFLLYQRTEDGTLKHVPGVEWNIPKISSRVGLRPLLHIAHKEGFIDRIPRKQPTLVIALRMI